MSNALEKRIPALIFCDPSAGSIRIAALTLLDRVVVAVHRGGCGPIHVVCSGKLPALKRSLALGIVAQTTATAPAMSGEVLVVDCRLLVQAGDIQAVIAQRGHLVTADGEALPVGIVEGTSLSTSDVETMVASRPAVRSSGVAGGVTDAVSAKAMERRLWASLGSSSDGAVDTYFNRPLGRFLSKALIHTPVTPNQVTVVSALVGLVSAYYFAQGNYQAGIVGAILLQLSALIDCVDGDIARVVFKESPIGKWLDLGLDQVVHVAVFATIAVGLHRAAVDAPVMALGISAVAGAVISFPVVVRARRLSTAEDSKLEKFIDAASTRDFTALILFLAVIARLEWFLWLTGVTVHIFWIIALALQFPKRAGSSPTRSGA